ncbi:MAG: 4-(cytidine 5'-diphospho)-2-C-methyl-D-erythritol kinase [Lachnospiraceae bacterium]
MKRVTVQAMAKINLGLDVLRRREDGYHQVRMIMQTVNLYDTLTFTAKEEPGIVVRTDHHQLPVDDSNLIVKAARILFEAYPTFGGVEISLTKRIPIAAGMAGGSTDAAAALVGLNQLFDLGCSEERLKELGVSIGADVPYCIRGGTVLCEGIGEKLTPLSPLTNGYLVIAKPNISVSTKYVYEQLQVNSLKHHPNIDAMAEAVGRQDLEKIAVYMENVLETVTEKEYPVITDLKRLLKKEGAMNSIMSGSGPTVFGLFSRKETAEQALKKIEESGMAVQYFCTTFAQQAQRIAEREE